MLAFFYRAISFEDALYLAVSVNADINTTLVLIVEAQQRGCRTLHCWGRVRPSYSAGSVVDAFLYC